MASHSHKLCWLFVLALLALPAAAQDVSQNLQHGTSVGAQDVTLFQPPEPSVCAGINGGFRGTVSILPAGGTAVGPDRFNRPQALYCAQFDTWIEHLGSEFAESVLGGFDAIQQSPSKTTVERYVRDNLRLVYVAYAVTFEKLPEEGAYRVSFSDSGAPKPAVLRPPGDWKMVSPPRYPLPQIVRDDDEIPLPLFVAKNGVRLVDYIRAGVSTKLGRRSGAPRDSYADDSEFTVTAPRLLVNGKDAGTAVVSGENHGTVLWIYVPGLGRYVIAYRQPPGLGFDWAGEVSGNGITLNAAGNLLRVECGDRIAAGGGAYNVYVRSDPEWKPPAAADRSRFLLGISASVEAAVAR